MRDARSSSTAPGGGAGSDGDDPGRVAAASKPLRRDGFARQIIRLPGGSSPAFIKLLLYTFVELGPQLAFHGELLAPAPCSPLSAATGVRRELGPIRSRRCGSSQASACRFPLMHGRRFVPVGATVPTPVSPEPWATIPAVAARHAAMKPGSPTALRCSSRRSWANLLQSLHNQPCRVPAAKERRCLRLEPQLLELTDHQKQLPYWIPHSEHRHQRQGMLFILIRLHALD